LNNQPSRNLTNELAKERNRDAADRTLMAWIRTCLSLISFGFGIDNIVTALAKTRVGNGADVVFSARAIGACFIILGIVALAFATVEHQRLLKRIRQDDFFYTPGRSLTTAVAVALTIIGVFALFAVLVKTVSIKI